VAEPKIDSTRAAPSSPAEGWAAYRERSGRFWLKLVVVVYRFVGKRFCSLLLYPVSLYFFLFAGTVRRSSLEFQARVHAGLGLAPRGRIASGMQCYRHILEFAWCLLDKFSAWQGDIERSHVEFHGRDQVRAYLDAGKGVVLLGAHLGNSEVLRAVSGNQPGSMVNAVMYTSHNPAFNEVLDDAAKDPTLRMIPSENFGPEMLERLRECISRGEVVAMLGDRIMPGSPDKAIGIPFLGSEAQFPVGPIVVSSLLECPVFLTFCFRMSDGSYQAFFEPFASRIELPRARRAAALEETLRRYVTRVEFYCKRYPLHWFNFYPFWK
jgi:predicted LPLAT superfamily acyltransferase